MARPPGSRSQRASRPRHRGPAVRRANANRYCHQTNPENNPMDDGDLDPGCVRNRVEDRINRLDALPATVRRRARECGHRVADGAPIFMRDALMHRHDITTVAMPRLMRSARTGRRVDLAPRGLVDDRGEWPRRWSNRHRRSHPRRWGAIRRFHRSARGARRPGQPRRARTTATGWRPDHLAPDRRDGRSATGQGARRRTNGWTSS